MRFNDILAESLERVLPYTWDEHGPTTYMASFAIGDIGYWFKAYQTRAKLPPANITTELWVCNFGIDKLSAERLHGSPHSTMIPSRTGNAHAVLATVCAAMDEFITSEQPETLWFSDSNGIRGRSRLYQRYAEHLVSRHGYSLDMARMEHFREAGQGYSVWVLRSSAFG